ncbi:MAG: NHL repeat-containing protein [Desulfonauticus sp.]|nr:NHL repeat-containing protein [Desulfonauticus sp.]
MVRFSDGWRGMVKKQMVRKQIYVAMFVLMALLVLPKYSLGWQKKERIKYVFSITRGKDFGSFGLLGSVFFSEQKQRLYVADATNNRILSFGADFNFLAEFNADGALSYPVSIVRDKRGRLFLSEPSRGQVLVVSLVKHAISPLDFSGIPSENNIYPGNLAIDVSGKLYVVDKANQRILIFDADLKFKKQILVKYGRGLEDVKVDDNGFVYTLSTVDGKICIFDKEGKLVFSFGKRGNGHGEFLFPVSLAIGPDGLIYVLDRHKSKVMVFNKKGQFMFEFSEFGWREGRLYLPSYLYINRAGQIFIVDQGNNRISIFQE